MCQNAFEGAFEQNSLGLNIVVGVEKLFDAGFLGQSLWTRPRKQRRYKVRATVRQLEERLIEKVLQHVQPPDIDDEADLWIECQHVGEVLFRADPDVDPAGLHAL